MSRNLFGFAAGGLLIASIPGFCDLESKIAQLEAEMYTVRGQTAYGNYGAKTASASPQIDGYGFFATADFLWWKLYEGGTDIFFKQKGTPNSLPLHGPMVRYNFDWAPGFKVGFGYHFEHDDWELYAEGTWFTTRAHRSRRTDAARLYSLAGIGSLPAREIDAHWHVGFYDATLVLGRNYFVSKYLSLHPMFGLISAWIDQHQKIDMRGKENEAIRLKSRNDFWGIGPRAGFETRYFFCPNYSLYGGLFGNLLWGDFKVREKEGEVDPHIPYYKEHSGLHRMVPAIAFTLGAAWETNFCKDRYHAMIKAGYENQYWWRQNQLPRFDSASLDFERKSEDLGLQGLTVEFRLDF